MTKSKKGSSTILIIMIVMTLTAMGMFSFLSAYQSYRLADKSRKTLSNYYRLEERMLLLQQSLEEEIEDNGISFLENDSNKMRFSQQIDQQIGEEYQVEISFKKNDNPEDGLQIRGNLFDKKDQELLFESVWEIEQDRQANEWVIAPVIWRKKPVFMTYKSNDNFSEIIID